MISSFAWLAFFGLPMVTSKTFYSDKDFPGKDWVSVGDGSSFMATPDSELVDYMRTYQQKTHEERFLQYSGGSYSSSSSAPDFTRYAVDGSETYWPEGSQAWRLIGFYIDCQRNETGYHERRHRDLGQNKDYFYYSKGCVRYLLWAAYIDVNYQGGGIGEYQYWDGESQSWDTSACTETGNSRCAKMDCHLRSDHFKLLGLFKEPNFSQFYEQLFKHQGVCLWNNYDEYSFMTTMRKKWPMDCTNSGVKDEKGKHLYFDMKPLPGAYVTLGLYTDERCSEDYTGRKDILKVIEHYDSLTTKKEENYTKYHNQQNNQNNEHHDEHHHEDEQNFVYHADLLEYMDDWNYLMNVYKQCQPCKAYNLSWVYGSDFTYAPSQAPTPAPTPAPTSAHHSYWSYWNTGSSSGSSSNSSSNSTAASNPSTSSSTSAVSGSSSSSSTDEKSPDQEPTSSVSNSFSSNSGNFTADQGYYKQKYGRYWYFYLKYDQVSSQYGNSVDRFNNFMNGYNHNEAQNANANQNEHHDDQQKKKKHDYSNDDSNGHFKCFDAAEYVNCNQCMKFSTKTKFMAATLEDALKGMNQGTLNPLYISRSSQQSYAYQTPFVLMGTDLKSTEVIGNAISGLVLLIGALMFLRSLSRLTSYKRDMKTAASRAAATIPEQQLDQLNAGLLSKST